jgi:hypothetical protein
MCPHDVGVQRDAETWFAAHLGRMGMDASLPTSRGFSDRIGALTPTPGLR